MRLAGLTCRKLVKVSVSSQSRSASTLACPRHTIVAEDLAGVRYSISDLTKSEIYLENVAHFATGRFACRTTAGWSGSFAFWSAGRSKKGGGFFLSMRRSGDDV